MRFGNCEKGAMLYVIGLFPLIILLFINKIAIFQAGEQVPFWYSLLMVMSMFLTFMGLIWIILSINKNRLRGLMDEIKPEEVVLLRITQDGIFIPQVAPKGTFGTAKTVIYGEDADFFDTGEFPMKTLNGNRAMLVYDLMNVSINPKRSVARKVMKKYVSDGRDGYKLAKKANKVIKSGIEEKEK